MKRKASGFTLIELLVVISIIALLISILLPALRQAREQAKSVKCGTNLKAMGTALETYKTENNAFYPGEHRTQGRTDYFVWPSRLRVQMSGQIDGFNCPSNPEEFLWERKQGYNGTVDVTLYGYDKGEIPVLANTFFSYGYNGWGAREFTLPHLGLGGHVDTNDNFEYREVQEIRVKAPGDMIVISDATTDGTYDATIYPWTNANRWPSNRHYGGSQTLLADTHIEYIKQDKMLELSVSARRRWNNDNLAHEDQWP